MGFVFLSILTLYFYLASHFLKYSFIVRLSIISKLPSLAFHQSSCVHTLLLSATGVQTKNISHHLELKRKKKKLQSRQDHI